MDKNSRLMAVLMLSGIWTSAANAEVGFGIRDSALQFNWLHGQAGDVRLIGGSDNPSRPLLSDGAALIGGENVTDPGYPFLGPWDASASWIVSHGFSVRGTRDDVQSIAATGFSKTDATANNCTSDLTADTNRLRLEFTVGGDPGSSTQVIFRSLFNETGALSSAVARIDQFTPFGWIAVDIGESDATSFFRHELSLGPGLYRFEGSAYSRAVAGGNPAFASAQYQMTLTIAGFTEPDYLPPIVPEPSTAAILTVVAFPALRRHRRQ